jgi:type VI protein secretion system component Hcp
MTETRCTLARAASAALLAMALHAPPADAGNMTLSLAGSNLTAAMEILAFSTNIANAFVAHVAGGGGTSRANYADFGFTAPQTAASTLIALRASSGAFFETAQLRIFSPDGAQLLSQWVLSNVIVGGFTANSGGSAQPRATAPTTFLPPVTSFQLRFSKYDYTVYASDGSVASHMCWNLETNTAC